MNYIVLEGVSLYIFLVLILLLFLLCIACLSCAILADKKNYILGISLTREKQKVYLLFKENFRLKIKHGEFDSDD